MPTAEYYRSEAERCRKLAEESRDAEAAQRWRALARDYAALADALESAPQPPAPVMHTPMQQQPVQQQQSKTQDEK